MLGPPNVKPQIVTESGLLYKAAGVSAVPPTQGDPAYIMSHCTNVYFFGEKLKK